MEILTGCASNLATKAGEFMFKKISYVFHPQRRVATLEEKVEELRARRDGVQHLVDAAERNLERIETEVNNWLNKVDNIINVEAKEVLNDLQNRAETKCLKGLCPNFKSRYKLSKKAEEDAIAVDELLNQGTFVNVSYRDDPQATDQVAYPKDFEAFDSRKKVFNEILEAVKDPNINIIGVYGMAGVGKTTLMYEVYRQVKEDKLFDSVVMEAVTKNPDIQKIQGRVAEQLGLKFEDQESILGRSIRLHQRLKREKKILVILDDFWTKLELKDLGIPVGDEHKGCTLLLTSRYLHVLNDMDARTKLEIGALRPEEAWNLFKKTVGNCVESPNLGSTPVEIAKKCAGLPLAVSTVARALRNQASFAWRDALRELNMPSPSNFSGVPAYAYLAIELSFNNLKSDELRQTFLLCSLLGHNASLHDLLKYGMSLRLFSGVRTVEETRDRLLTVVSHLKDSCLLLDSYNNQRFDMHDLICDVAISIASKDNRVFALRHEDVLTDWPDGETCEKISLQSASITKLPGQLKCPKLSFLRILTKDPFMEIPTDFFEEMRSLKVLDFTGMHFPSLPSSICELANLGTLCLDDCVLGDISIVGELKNLEILSLLSSDIEMLPQEVGHLTKLKMLDLTRCTGLKIIPAGVFSSLSRLEELLMDNSFVQWEEDEGSNAASLAEFKALSCLTALEVQIPDAKLIPEDLFFEKLQRYKVFIGEAWVWDWDSVGVIEYKKTLKIKLHTSIGHLSYGMKMLLMKAENLYVDEMKGVEILLNKSDGRECFQQLKNLCIKNGASLLHIIKCGDGVDKIEFVQLQTLTLQALPNLISFCFENNGSASTSQQGLPLFNEKIVFPKLENLKLSSVSKERIWEYQPSRGFHSFPNLTSFIIEGCSNLKHVLSYSMAECLQQLKSLEIIDCNSIQLIISTEETTKTNEDGKRAVISFPRLDSLKLKRLHKLTGFCPEDYTVEFKSLKFLEIDYCPELKGFITNKPMGKEIAASSSTDEVLFNEKVSLPNLEKMVISQLRNVKRLWYDRLHRDSFRNLKELKVDNCVELLNIFSSSLLGVFQRLERLTVTCCGSLEQVFQHFQVQEGFDVNETCAVDIQIRQVRLNGLPKLKEVWSMDPQGKYSFHNLRDVDVCGCESLKSVFPFSIAKGLMHLDSLKVDSCKVMVEIVSKNINEESPQEICFEFRQLSFLILWGLPNLKWFYPGVHTIMWPELKKLITCDCNKIQMFGNEKSETQQPLFLLQKDIPRLEEVFFNSDDIAMLCDAQFPSDFFAHIKALGICSYFEESSVFPFSFIQKYYNMQMLEYIQFVGCYFEELSPCEDDADGEKHMFWKLPKIKELKLNGCFNITQLWKQGSALDHMCSNSLETLSVFFCYKLINLESASSSFQNLTLLDVWDCNEMTELIASSKAQSLGRLATLKIRGCGKMTEIIASDEGADEATNEIIFRELKHLELHSLHSLKGFCLGYHTFKFPSLEEVHLSECPSLKSFCVGALFTPKLQRVHLEREYNNEHHWAGDLNTTIEKLHEK